MPWHRQAGPPWGHRHFRGCNYRITVGREVIWGILNNTKKHMSAEEIYMAAKKSNPGIGLTSVYRTLELFTEMGVLSKFDFGDGRARYELADSSKDKDHHHHLICTGCKRVVDYTDFVDEELEFLKRAEKGLAKKYNFQIRGHTIHFYGLCEKCKRKPM